MKNVASWYLETLRRVISNHNTQVSDKGSNEIPSYCLICPHTPRAAPVSNIPSVRSPLWSSLSRNTLNPGPWPHSHRFLSKLKVSKDKKKKKKKSWERVFVPLWAANKSSLHLNLKDRAENRLGYQTWVLLYDSLGGMSTLSLPLEPGLVWTSIVTKKESSPSMSLLSESDHIGTQRLLY